MDISAAAENEGSTEAAQAQGSLGEPVAKDTSRESQMSSGITFKDCGLRMEPVALTTVSLSKVINYSALEQIEFIS